MIKGRSGSTASHNNHKLRVYAENINTFVNINISLKSLLGTLLEQLPDCHFISLSSSLLTVDP